MLLCLCIWTSLFFFFWLPSALPGPQAAVLCVSWWASSILWRVYWTKKVCGGGASLFFWGVLLLGFLLSPILKTVKFIVWIWLKTVYPCRKWFCQKCTQTPRVSLQRNPAEERLWIDVSLWFCVTGVSCRAGIVTACLQTDRPSLEQRACWYPVLFWCVWHGNGRIRVEPLRDACF